jgi:hypothetical protein
MVGHAVAQVDRHSGQSSSRSLMKQADDAKGSKCRPIIPDQRPLQLFPSDQVIRHLRCGAATRASSPVLLIIHVVYFDIPLDIAKRARLTIIRGNQHPRLIRSREAKEMAAKDKEHTQAEGRCSPSINAPTRLPPAAGTYAASRDTTSLNRT